MHQNESPIGVFDSGVGGLTVLEALRGLLPAEDFIYLGDTARVPYGNRTPQTIVRYAVSCARQLVDRGVKALVIACNTASAHALGPLQEIYRIPVLGMIEPASQMAVSRTWTGHIAVIGTRATIASGSYLRAIHALMPDAVVHGHACPLFVPIVEENWTDTDIARLVVERYMRELRESDPDRQIDTLIMGCTHYPVLKPVIGGVLKKLGYRIALCDCGAAAAGTLRRKLREMDMLRDASHSGSAAYLVTDDPDQFLAVARSFMKNPPENVEHIDIV